MSRHQLSDAKERALDSARAWRELRSYTIAHLLDDEGLLDCTDCHRAFIVRCSDRHALRAPLWRCICSPSTNRGLLLRNNGL